MSGKHTMRIAHAAFVVSLLSVAIPLACAESKETLGSLPGDAGSASDAASNPDHGAPSFGDAASTSASCQLAAAQKTSVGCEFFSVPPDAFNNATGGCFAAYLSNGGTADVTISIDFAGSAITNFADFARVPSGSGPSITYSPLAGAGNVVHPGQVAILFLAGSFDPVAVHCPAGVTPAFVGDAALHGTGVGRSFHIATDNPVTAYDIYPYGGGISAYAAASLLLPTISWGTNYLAVDGYALSNPGEPWITIVGLHDGTQVTIRPAADIVGGGGLSGSAKGAKRTYPVNRGQVLQFTQGEELVGSPITSTSPVGVFGGATCMTVPVAAYACDTGHQQIPPVHALGSEYVYARYRDRYAGIPEAPPVRIVGAVDGTTLSYDPSGPSGAPQTINAGQMVEFRPSDAFAVRSQDDMHPFYVAAYMTGCTEYDPSSNGSDAGDAGAFDAGSGDCRGDPEFVNLVPPGEFADSYVFFTDPTYPETELVVVRQKGPKGFADVQLDCLGAPVSGWKDVGTGGTYQYARVDLVTGNFAKVGACDNGQHHMSSGSPFGVTIWGWGSGATGGSVSESGQAIGNYSQWVSYAYPGGMSIAPLNSVVIQ
jgi:hypothetical protein